MQSRALAQLLMTSVRPLGDVLRPTGPHLRLAREAFEGIGLAPLPYGTRVRNFAAGNLRGQWVSARRANAAAGAMLYLHGGGFVFGSARTYRRLAAQLSAAAGVPVLLLDYRRAPEHPFPAAADDGVAIYRWLLRAGFPPTRLVLAGDSAGGHLTASLLANIARARLPMPAASCLLSPFLDLSGAELAARDRLRRDPFVPPSYAKACGRAYAGGIDVSHHSLDVLRLSKRGWPPTLIQVGATECLSADAERMAESLERSGVPCELQVWPGQVHVFHWFSPFIPEAGAAINYIGEFLRTAGNLASAA